MKTYCIKEDYTSRKDYTHYDDRSEEDKWQLEIYLHALGLMKKYNLSKVADIGCGSGYKLMTYLSDYETIGLELEQNIPFLREKYPDALWMESAFDSELTVDVDVLICSDVIEHIVNPDDLIHYIQKMSFKYLIFSTPERELVYPSDSIYLNGPPKNPAHQREWNFQEFNNYIQQHFEVMDHRVTNLHQATQMIICKKKD